MNLAYIEKVIKTIQKSEISELVLEEGDLKIAIKQTLEKKVPVPAEAVTQDSAALSTQSSCPPAASPAMPREVFSDGVGVFHPLFSSKDIAEGKSLKKGTPLFFIKAMNIEHPQAIEKDCKLVRFLVQEGTPVEYGQPVALVNDL